MKWQSSVLALVVLLLAGCTHGYTPTGPTAEAIGLQSYGTIQAAEAEAANAHVQMEIARATEQAAQAIRDHQVTLLTAEAQRTVDAHQRTIEAQNVWATQQSANATQVAEATARAIVVQATTEAQHVAATATERGYRATATQQTIDQRATTTAQAIAIAETATRQAWEARTTATAEAWEATRQAEHLMLTRQAEKREATLGAVRDFGVPFLLLLLVGGMGVLVAYGTRQILQQMARRPIVYPRNFFGDADPMAVPDRDGGYTLVDLDRQPGHVTRVLSGGQVEAPQFRSAGQEERTTYRDQMVDGATRPRIGSGAQRTPPPALAASQQAAPPRAPAPGLRSVRVLRRLDQAGRAGFLPPALLTSLEADWTEVTSDLCHDGRRSNEGLSTDAD
jgi:hypothetical protein